MRRLSQTPAHEECPEYFRRPGHVANDRGVQRRGKLLSSRRTEREVFSVPVAPIQPCPVITFNSGWDVPKRVLAVTVLSCGSSNLTVVR